MKNLLVSILLATCSFTYADYVIYFPLETQKGGSLPINSIKFNVASSETPTDPADTPTYENTSGSFGTGNSGAIITAETVAKSVDRTSVSYTLTTTHKIIFDSVHVEEVGGTGGNYSNAAITYQNCSGSGPYICVINISATESDGVMDPYNGLGEINDSGIGMILDITFNGRYQTN